MAEEGTSKAETDVGVARNDNGDDRKPAAAVSVSRDDGDDNYDDDDAITTYEHKYEQWRLRLKELAVMTQNEKDRLIPIQERGDKLFAEFLQKDGNDRLFKQWRKKKGLPKRRRVDEQDDDDDDSSIESCSRKDEKPDEPVEDDEGDSVIKVAV